MQTTILAHFVAPMSQEPVIQNVAAPLELMSQEPVIQNAAAPLELMSQEPVIQNAAAPLEMMVSVDAWQEKIHAE